MTLNLGYTATPVNADLDTLPQHVPGSGRRAQTLGSYLNSNVVFEPRDWTALANGAADDSQHVQDAHDAAVAQNGECVLGLGIYRVATNRTFAGGLTIRRGAKLKPGNNATITLGPLTAGLHQVFDLTESGSVKFQDGAVDEVRAEWFGWGPAKTAAQNRLALLAAYLALPATKGATVKAGPGRVTLDVNQADGGLRVQRDNFSFKGAGIQRSHIQYDSSSCDGSYGRGSPFILNISAVVTNYDNINFEDFTIEDTNAAIVTHAGHIPAAIDGQGITNFRTSRVEFINCKGNGCLTVLGDSVDDLTAGTGDHIVEDCLFRGTVGGGWIQRDGYNGSRMGRLFYRRNRHEGGASVGPNDGHCFEGGTGIGELYIEDCYFDLNNRGLGAVGSFTLLRSGKIARNLILNWSNSSSAIPLNPDNPAYPVNELRIVENTFISTFSALAAVSVQDGTYTQGLTIAFNYFECVTPISLAKIAQGVCTITKNTARWTLGIGNVFIVPSGSPTFVNTSDILEISHNTLQGRTNLLTVDFTVFTLLKGLKALQVRGLHTTILQSVVTGQIDGQFFQSQSINTAVANGADSAIFTIACLGAKQGDVVKIRKRSDGINAAPNGVVYHGWVSADDTVQYYYHNNSGAAYGAGPVSMDIIGTVERS